MCAFYINVQTTRTQKWGGKPSLTAEYMQASELRELHLFDK